MAREMKHGMVTLRAVSTAPKTDRRWTINLNGPKVVQYKQKKRLLVTKYLKE